MDARTGHYQKRVSRRQEEQMATDLGGRPQPASGAMPGAKGDVRAMGQFRGEAKYTNKKQYTLHHDDLRKLRAQALNGSVESPVFQVSFVSRTGADVYAVIPWDDYLTLLERSKDAGD